jgi:hypothetical protein
MLSGKLDCAEINTVRYVPPGNSYRAVDIPSPAIGIHMKRVTLDRLSTSIVREDKLVVYGAYE